MRSSQGCKDLLTPLKSIISILEPWDLRLGVSGILKYSVLENMDVGGFVKPRKNCSICNYCFCWIVAVVGVG